MSSKSNYEKVFELWSKGHIGQDRPVPVEGLFVDFSSPAKSWTEEPHNPHAGNWWCEYFPARFKFRDCLFLRRTWQPRRPWSDYGIDEQIVGAKRR
jgi:hypothetical protein